MKKIFVLISFMGSVYAGPVALKMEQLSAKGLHNDACLLGFSTYRNVLNNESFLSLTAQECLKSDNINHLPILGVYLKSTPEYRMQSLYFTAIYQAKRLLYGALVDGLTLKGTALPKTDHFMTMLVEKIGKNEVKKNGNIWEVTNANKHYKLWSVQEGKEVRMYIEESVGGQKTLHTYW